MPPRGAANPSAAAGGLLVRFLGGGLFGLREAREREMERGERKTSCAFEEGGFRRLGRRSQLCPPPRLGYFQGLIIIDEEIEIDGEKAKHDLVF